MGLRLRRLGKPGQSSNTAEAFELVGLWLHRRTAMRVLISVSSALARSTPPGSDIVRTRSARPAPPEPRLRAVDSRCAFSTSCFVSGVVMTASDGDLGRLVTARPLVLVGGLAANLLSLATPLAVLVLFERSISPGAVGTTAAVALALAGALALEQATRLAMIGLLAAHGAALERRAGRIVVDRLLSGDGREEAGVHLGRIDAAARLRDLRSGDTALMLLDAPFAVLFLLILNHLAPSAALTVAVMAALAFALAAIPRAAAERLRGANEEREARRYSFLGEMLSNIETVRALNLAPFMARRYERLLRAGSAGAAAEREMTWRGQAAGTTVAQATPLVVACVCALEVTRGALEIGPMIAAIMLSARAMQPLVRLDAAVADAREARQREKALRALVPDAPAARPRPAPGPIRSLALSRVVSAQTIGGAPILDGVDIIIETGECVAVSGASGSGKSLLLRLLSGDVAPASGEAMANGAPLSAWDRDAIRGRIALIETRPRLVAGTLLENMTRFRTDRHGAEAMRLAEELGIADFLDRHPVGVNLRCAGGGANGLPRSVAQRVPLIGALVGRPDVILFDEANSQLDHDGDARLLACLQRLRGECAIVMVTQRPSWTAIADRRLRIDQRRLASADVAGGAEGAGAGGVGVPLSASGAGRAR